MMANERRTNFAPLPWPSEGSHHLEGDALDWQPTDAAGFSVKPLLSDPATGARTELWHMEPGAQVGAHSHDQLEEILVLSGEFSDDERTYRAGDYCVRAPGALHTARSERGCTVLVIYRS
jgi:anti-sigma factor ChrR (cupin superfamily)